VKLLNKIAIFAFACLAVPACSGGGPGHPLTNATPTPSPSGSAPTPSPTGSSSIANTNVPGYLPFGSGDEWTFTNGSKVTDEGSTTLTGCSCAADGTTIERMDLTSSSAVYTGSLIYAKGTWGLPPYTGHALTYLVGISNDHGATISLFYYSDDGTVPGVPAIDDSPIAGESFAVPPPVGIGSGSLAITSVGGTQTLGAQTIISVAVTTLVAGGQTTNFNYAPGVGFTSVSLASGPMTLASFSLSGASGSAVVRHVVQTNVHVVKPNNPDASHSLSSMLRAWAAPH
jgi:hypothetical protein